MEIYYTYAIKENVKWNFLNFYKSLLFQRGAKWKTVHFEPINIGKLEIKNRYAMAPMGPLCSANNNTCNMMPKVLI